MPHMLKYYNVVVCLITGAYSLNHRKRQKIFVDLTISSVAVVPENELLTFPMCIDSMSILIRTA
jgi:hypothetical protein